jgi:uncharacterized membrane protein
MSRNLYILAATLFFFSLISFVLVWSNGNPQTGSPGDAALWKTIALVLMVFSLLAALLGTISGLFEQAHRRHAEREENVRRFGDRPARRR